MRAFKGCTNLDCKAYKKTYYKKDDHFCVKCGQTLSFVCSECWKPMEDDKEKYCISCSAEKEQKKAQAFENIKKAGASALVTLGVVAGVVKQVGDNADKLANGAKKVANAGVKITKLIKK